MLHRGLRRPLGALALGAVLGTTAGCASTHRFLVDPDAASQLVVEAIDLGDMRMLRFDADGGRYDPAARVIRGRDDAGRPREIALARVSRVTFRTATGARGAPIAGHPGPLRRGAAWRPNGRAQVVVKLTGEVVNLRGLPSRIDPTARVVGYTPKSGPPVDIPFADIAYLQVRDTHPGRTLLCLLGLGFIGLGIGIRVSGGVSL